jgi:hypothetical protein
VAIVACIALLLVGVLVWRHLARAPDEPELVDRETELLALCLGDRTQMERLIALETKRFPGILRAAAIDRAVHAMRRDTR